MSEAYICELHPDCGPLPVGYTCPACQRTDSEILALRRAVIRIEKRLAEMEARCK